MQFFGIPKKADTIMCRCNIDIFIHAHTKLKEQQYTQRHAQIYLVEGTKNTFQRIFDMIAIEPTQQNLPLLNLPNCICATTTKN